MRDLAGNPYALIVDLTGCTRVDTNDRTADRRLAGAGFTDQGEGFSLVNIKGSILDGADGIFALAESDVNVLYRKDNLSAIFIDWTVFRQMGRGFCHFIRHFCSPPFKY